MFNFRIRFSILQQARVKDLHEKQRKSFVLSAGEHVPRSSAKKRAAWALKKRKTFGAGARVLGAKIPNVWEEAFGDFF
jgi:hypothetical protein